MTIKKEFTLDMAALGKEFDLEKNRVKREAYRANHTREQKKEVLAKWREFMKEISSNVPFFEYFENHFEWHKKNCVVIKTNWTKEDPKEVVQSSHPPLDKITFKHKKTDVVASPFQHPTSEEVVVSKVIAQNNHTNQCLHIIGKQLDRMEEKVEKKVILQPGNPSKPSPTLKKPLVKLSTTRQANLKSKDQTALEICLQKMEELVKKEPVTPSPDTTSSSRLVTLDIHTASSSSSRTSSDSGKEIETLKNQSQDSLSQVPPPKKWISKYRGKESSETFHRKRIVAKEYRKHKLKAEGSYNKKKSSTPKASGKCLKCGKRGHLRTKCESKDGTLTNTIVCNEPASTSEPRIQAPQVVVPEAKSTRPKKEITVNDL